jgi:hypothetical protein
LELKREGEVTEKQVANCPQKSLKEKILSFGSRLNVSGLIFREKPDDFGNFVEKNLFLRVF